MKLYLIESTDLDNVSKSYSESGSIQPESVLEWNLKAAIFKMYSNIKAYKVNDLTN